MRDDVVSAAAGRAVAAWVREQAEEKDYAQMCEWRNVADAIEREAAQDHLWVCTDCRCLNGDHEVFCFRCGAGQPDLDQSSVSPADGPEPDPQSGENLGRERRVVAVPAPARSEHGQEWAPEGSAAGVLSPGAGRRKLREEGQR